MKRSWILLGAVAAALALSVQGTRTHEAQGEKRISRKEWSGLSYAASLIRSGYVEEVADTRLYEGAMNGMMKTLDPYSQFLDAKAYDELKADTQGRFAGLGFEISVKGGILHVIAPLAGSPAERAGIRAGDIIMKIDGQPSKDLSLTEAVRRLRGEPGSIVLLHLVREGSGNGPIEVTVTREVVNVKGVREAHLLDGGVGYIRIAEFQEQTPDDFKAGLKELTDAGAKALIIDLRNNPGGLLDSAVKVTEQFIPKGELIVSTRGRKAPKTRELRSSNERGPFGGRIAILVNKGSASGSEILAGALKDHGLARIFGKKTYGKGCVQTLTGLADGSAVRITTSYYYTPKGGLIHEVGILPDEEIADETSGPDAALAAALAWAKSA